MDTYTIISIIVFLICVWGVIEVSAKSAKHIIDNKLWNNYLFPSIFISMLVFSIFYFTDAIGQIHFGIAAGLGFTCFFSVCLHNIIALFFGVEDE